MTNWFDFIRDETNFIEFLGSTCDAESREYAEIMFEILFRVFHDQSNVVEVHKRKIQLDCGMNNNQFWLERDIL